MNHEKKSIELLGRIQTLEEQDGVFVEQQKFQKIPGQYLQDLEIGKIL